MDWNEFLIDQLTSPEKLVGHLSYLLLILSMMMRSMTWLRIVAISAGLVSAVYGYALGEFVIVFWEVIFVSVNLIQLLILEIENRRAKFSEFEKRFIEHSLPGVEKAHAKRLLRIAAVTEHPAGEVLTTENQPVDELHFILEGAVRIDKGGSMVGVCGHNDFIGEIGFMLGSNASATAVVTNDVKCFTFSHSKLREMLVKEDNLRHALDSSFNRNLVGKLVKSNEGQGIVSVPLPLGGEPQGADKDKKDNTLETS